MDIVYCTSSGIRIFPHYTKDADMKKITSGIFFLLIPLFLSGCASTLYRQGSTLLKTEHYDEAIDVLHKNLETDSFDYKSWRNIGIAFEKKGNFDKAIEHLGKAYSITPDDGETILHLGLAYEGKQDYDNALQYYKNYSKLGMLSSTKSIIEGRIELISRKKSEAEVQSALKNEKSINVDAIPANSVAVLYFRNLGKNHELDPLQKGLTEMIITDLSKVKSLQVIERVKLQKLLDEMKLGQSGAVDAATAPRVGKLLGVSKLMQGTYLDLDAENLRFDVNVVGVKDAKVLQSTKTTSPMAAFFKAQKELTFNIIKEMGFTLTDEEREAIQVIPTESYLAFVAYSKGLDLEDRGYMQEAASQYMQAAAIDPNFTSASAKAENVEKMEQGKSDISKIDKSALDAQVKADRIDRLNNVSLNLTNEVVQATDNGVVYKPSNQNGVPVKIEITVPAQTNTAK